MTGVEPTRVRWRSLALDPECVLGSWARLTVCALTENMGGSRCFVSVATIAARMGASERLVYNALAELEREGFLLVERQAGTTNRYRRALPPLHDMQGSEGRTTAPTTAPTTARTPARRADEPDNQRTRQPEVLARDESRAPADSQSVVAFFVDRAGELGIRPPRRLVGQVAARVAELVAEGFDQATIEAAITIMLDRRLHPATLPSLMVEAQAGPAPPRRPEHPSEAALRRAGINPLRLLEGGDPA